MYVYELDTKIFTDLKIRKLKYKQFNSFIQSYAVNK